MTLLKVVSPLTNFDGSGEIDLGNYDLHDITIGEVKQLVHHLYSEILEESQDLWWKGYILDNDSLPINEACVGVNGEVIDQNQQSLTLFITVREGEEVNERNRFRFKKRSSSFDLEFYRNEIRQQRKEMCILM